MWKSVTSLTLFFLAALLLAGCASVDPVIKIGLVGPFEGRYRDTGYDAIYGARLAVGEANAASGIGGYRVALVALDDRGDPELAAQAAASLALDPAVVAVAGHYLPETTAAAQPIYREAGLPLIVTGAPPFGASDPETLPAAFREAYAAVTPFDEVAGPYAGSTYDAFGLLWEALAAAKESEGNITRSSVQEALRGLQYDGVTGEVYQP
jgi:ABC-type branched-subunit amino acid transport system substrate-binding protein